MVRRFVTVGAVPGQFSTWTPGTVKPIGLYQAGVTNVGSRLGPSLSAAYTQIGSPTSQVDFTASTNTAYTALEIWGEVFTPAGSGITFTDCIIHGPNKATTSTGAIRGSSQNGRGNTFNWCTLDGTGRESPWTDAVKGTNFNLNYCDITRFNDGLGWSGTSDGGSAVNCAIYNGYFTAWRHSTDGSAYPNNPPSPSDMKSHSDGCQWQGYAGMLIDGCFIGGTATKWAASDLLVNRDPDPAVASPTSPFASQLAFQQFVDSGTDFQDSAILVQSNSASHPTGGTIQRNWLAGGTSTLNLNTNAANGDYLNGVTVINNRLIPNKDNTGSGHGYGLYMNNNCQATVTGNVDDSTGLLVPISYVEGGTGTQPF